MKESWVNYLLAIARGVSTKSKDPRTKVGAVAVDSAHFIKSTGFNGIPIGVEDFPDRYAPENKPDFVSHSEENLVASAARLVLEGTTVVVTHPPCPRCARLLIQAGVKEVIVGSGKFSTSTTYPIEKLDIAKTMFLEAGVRCEHVEEGEVQ